MDKGPAGERGDQRDHFLSLPRPIETRNRLLLGPPLSRLGLSPVDPSTPAAIVSLLLLLEGPLIALIVHILCLLRHRHRQQHQRQDVPSHHLLSLLPMDRFRPQGLLFPLSAPSVDRGQPQEPVAAIELRRRRQGEPRLCGRRYRLRPGPSRRQSGFGRRRRALPTDRVFLGQRARLGRGQLLVHVFLTDRYEYLDHD